MINLMYVIVLTVVSVEENILNFVVLRHCTGHEEYEQTKVLNLKLNLKKNENIYSFINMIKKTTNKCQTNTTHINCTYL